MLRQAGRRGRQGLARLAEFAEQEGGTYDRTQTAGWGSVFARAAQSQQEPAPVERRKIIARSIRQRSKINARQQLTLPGASGNLDSDFP